MAREENIGETRSSSSAEESCQGSCDGFVSPHEGVYEKNGGKDLLLKGNHVERSCLGALDNVHGGSKNNIHNLSQWIESVSMGEREKNKDMLKLKSESLKDKRTNKTGGTVSSNAFTDTWGSLSSSENGRDIKNLVRFVNSASNDIKEAMDKSSNVPKSSSSTSAVSSNPSFPYFDHIRDDKRRTMMSYFNSRDSVTTNPLKVLKVEPLNVVKVKPLDNTSSVETENKDKGIIAKHDKIPSDNPPSKRIKMSEEEYCKETGNFPSNGSGTIGENSRNSSQHQSQTLKGNALSERKDVFTNPVPLRKRRLPASFWQEPGKSENHRPKNAEEKPFRHTAFMPIAPHQSPSFGRYVKDFLGSNLSASEKLELLRLNSIERENSNRFLLPHDLSEKRCPRYPCVLLHCKNQHDEYPLHELPTLFPRTGFYMNSLPGAPAIYPGRVPLSMHHDGLANVLGMSLPPANATLPDIFRPDSLIPPRCDHVANGPYGSRVFFPMEGPSYFPLSSQLHHSIIRPVPKKHSSSLPSPFHSTFDVR